MRKTRDAEGARWEAVRRGCSIGCEEQMRKLNLMEGEGEGEGRVLDGSSAASPRFLRAGTVAAVSTSGTRRID